MKPSPVHLQTLNDLIDRLLKKHTPEQACIILKKALDSPTAAEKTNEIICDYIVHAAIAIFELNIKRLKRRITKEYIRESWCIFYLVKKHTSYSYQRIADYWKLEGIKPVRYGIEQIEDLLSNPKIDKELHEKYIKLQQKVEQFIVNE